MIDQLYNNKHPKTYHNFERIPIFSSSLPGRISPSEAKTNTKLTNYY